MYRKERQINKEVKLEDSLMLSPSSSTTEIMRALKCVVFIIWSQAEIT